MTIKHLGGIFGRNPTFNDVDVDGYLDVDGGTLYVDPSNDRIGVNTTTPTTTAHIKSGIYNHFIGDGTLITGSNFSADSTVAYGTTAYASLAFYTWNQQRGRFTPEGDLQLNTGNLIVANGKGIDFSATSGTGTSELFDDYEEGTFTPTFSATGLTVTYDSQFGGYTKIGNVVYFRIQLGTDAVSGGSGAETLRISGLPFSAGGVSASSGFGLAYGAATSFADAKWFINSGTSLLLYAGDGTAGSVFSDWLGTGVNSNRIYLTGHYHV